jgi:class 3 adenylate cyclase
MSETRKLAAILVADVVCYGRLASTDEDRTRFEVTNGVTRLKITVLPIMFD